MSKMDNWFRKHDPRRPKAPKADKSRPANLQKVDSIMARQNSGEISEEEASLEFDEMLMESSDDGRLIYYSDSTGITADWHPDLMLFPKPGSTPTERVPSNTGIFARGPQRGWLFTKPGETPDCMPEVLEHFTTGSKGWINGPARTVEQPESDAKPDVL